VPNRHLAAALGLLACIVLIAALTSGGGARISPQLVHVAPKPKPPPPKRKPTGVDRALRYTDWIGHGSPRRREVALTFDDGPSPWTPKLVKALRRLHAHATFFPIGYAIERYPRYLKLVHRSGFTIGDHTMTHPQMSTLSGPRQLPEIDGQARLLRSAKVPYPRLFRPPYGSFDKNTLGLLQERRMLMVMWSVNPEDYYRPGSGIIVERVLEAVRPGAIVLMHDGGGDRSETVAAVPRIVRRLRHRGYRIVSVPRLLADDPPPRHQGTPPEF
jgi:peptidoglycan/xylan/chitin deacetylase (PgdA/CDA1 family)